MSKFYGNGFKKYDGELTEEPSPSRLRSFKLHRGQAGLAFGLDGFTLGKRLATFGWNQPFVAIPERVEVMLG